jgi:hypothetical protein
LKFSGLTLSGHPTFWFYIGYDMSKVRTGKFTLSLEGQSGDPVFETEVNLPEKPGFFRVSLPTTATPLEQNQQYKWNFTLFCLSNDPNDRSKTVYHVGMVERVDLPGLESQLKTASLPQQRINLYIQNKIWYDASTDLAKIQESPQAWRELMRAMDLEQLAQEAIAGSVVLSNKEE